MTEPFVEIASPKTSNRNVVLPVEKALDALRLAIKGDRPFYFSYFAYDREARDQITATGSVANRRDDGRRYFIRPPMAGENSLLIDFDGEGGSPSESLSNSLPKAREAVSLLTGEHGVDESHIRVFFSGSKGIHLSIPDLFGFTEGPRLPYDLRQTMLSIFPDADPKIWIPTGLIRAPYSKHGTTGLYKTPLTLDELFTLGPDEIVQLGRTPLRKVELPEPVGHANPLAKLIVKAPEVEERVAPYKNGSSGDVSHVATCVHRMMTTDVSEGARHDTMMAIASTYRRHGLPAYATERVVWEWVEQHGNRASASRKITREEVEKLVRDTYSVPYELGCHHPTLAAFCSSRCIYYKRKNLFPALKNASEQAREFERFRQMVASGEGIDLFGLFELPKVHMVYPGDLVVVMGETGMGKSAFVQEIARRLGQGTERNQRKTVWWYDLEAVGVPLLFRRWMQQAHGLSKDDVMARFEPGMESAISHIKMSDEIADLYDLMEDVRKHRPQVVVIDTLDSLSVAGVRDDNLFGKIQTAMPLLKDLSKEMMNVIIVVSHVHRSATEGKLLVTSGLGGGAIERKGSQVWAIEGSTRETPIRQLRSLKTRDEKPMEQSFHFDAENTFRFDPYLGASSFPFTTLPDLD